jgi:hypothetical protein
MSQRIIKIIVFVVGLVIIVGVLIFGYFSKTQQVVQINFTSKDDTSFAYNLCKEQYLEQPQISAEGVMAAVAPQVFCKIEEDNKVKLIPNNKVAQELRAGDSIITIVNVPRLMNQKYFDAMTTFLAQPSFKLPEKDFYLCVAYKPFFSAFFDSSSKFKLDTVDINQIRCSLFKTLDELTPLGIAAKIPINDKGESFGLSIFIPILDTTSFKEAVLTQEEAKNIVNQKQYFMLYNTILSIQ